MVWCYEVISHYLTQYSPLDDLQHHMTPLGHNELKLTSRDYINYLAEFVFQNAITLLEFSIVTIISNMV